MSRRTLAAALCLSASLALLPLQVAAAQDRSSSPAPEQLWRAYPLNPTVTPSAQPLAAPPPARAQPDRRPLGVAGTDRASGAPVVVLVLVALSVAAAAMTFLEIRRRRKPEPPAAAVPIAREPVGTAPVPPPLWRARTGRFTPATPRPTRARPAASARDPGQGGPRAGREMPPPAAAVAPAPPPDRTCAWTAEIEWRQRDAEGAFRVVARPTEGHGEATIAESARLEWPPKGPASVERLRRAAEQLEASLLAAEWEPLPGSGTWYAKRFAWQARHPAEAATPAKPARAR